MLLENFFDIFKNNKKSLIKKFQYNPRVYKKLQKYDDIRAINFFDFDRLAQMKEFNLEKRFYDIFLYKNGARQRVSPLKECNSAIKPYLSKNHEYLRISISTNVQIYHSSIIKGSKRTVSDYKTIENEIVKLINNAQKHSEEIKQISLVHTHPTVEIIGNNKKQSMINIHPLSKKDISVLAKLSEFIPWPISLTAITRNGIEYTSRTEDIFNC